MGEAPVAAAAPGEGRWGKLEHVVTLVRAAAGPADTAALPACAARGQRSGTDWPAWLDRVVEREGVIKSLTVRDLICTCI